LRRFLTVLTLAVCLLSIGANADQGLAKGKLLVATDDVFGPMFAETVVLLLHYDEFGAIGLVVNRPLDAIPADAMPDMPALADYEGTLYWGGPVQQYALRALLRTDVEPEHALRVFGAVYLVPPEDELVEHASTASTLRFYVGYAGWAAGQLDAEMDRGSWHVLPATEKSVFAKEPGEVWRQLLPPREYRAAINAAVLARMR